MTWNDLCQVKSRHSDQATARSTVTLENGKYTPTVVVNDPLDNSINYYRMNINSSDFFELPYATYSEIISGPVNWGEKGMTPEQWDLEAYSSFRGNLFKKETVTFIDDKEVPVLVVATYPNTIKVLAKDTDQGDVTVWEKKVKGFTRETVEDLFVALQDAQDTSASDPGFTALWAENFGFQATEDTQRWLDGDLMPLSSTSAARW